MGKWIAQEIYEKFRPRDRNKRFPQKARPRFLPIPLPEGFFEEMETRAIKQTRWQKKGKCLSFGFLFLFEDNSFIQGLFADVKKYPATYLDTGGEPTPQGVVRFWYRSPKDAGYEEQKKTKEPIFVIWGYDPEKQI